MLNFIRVTDCLKREKTTWLKNGRHSVRKFTGSISEQTKNSSQIERGYFGTALSPNLNPLIRKEIKSVSNLAVPVRRDRMGGQIDKNMKIKGF